jgi:hypothetical protein
MYFPIPIDIFNRIADAGQIITVFIRSMKAEETVIVFLMEMQLPKVILLDFVGINH